MIILLDTILLARLTDVGCPEQPLVEEAINRLEMAGHELVLVPQVMYEYRVVATRPPTQRGSGRNPTAAADELAEFLTLFRLFKDERGIFPPGTSWSSRMTSTVNRPTMRAWSPPCNSTPSPPS